MGDWSIKRNYYETPIFFFLRIFFIEYYETTISINKSRQSIWLKKQNIYVPVDTGMLFWNYYYFNIYIYIYIYSTLYNIKKKKIYIYIYFWEEIIVDFIN